MNDDDNKTNPGRGSDRRSGKDRRQTNMDPKDLPFPDRRKGDRRTMDRRVISEEESQEILNRVVPQEAPTES
jgi:hypothetical protein